MRRRDGLPFVLLALLTSAGCLPEEADFAEADDLDSPAQTDARLRFRYFAYATENTRAVRSTGALQVSYHQTIGGADHRGSCGLTFISPHYAITAAHCVSSAHLPNPASDQFPVEIYDISAVDAHDLASSEWVWGDFPYIERYPLESYHGYRVQRFQCTVTARCAYGSYGCSFSSDIALINCPTRARNADYMPIASSDPRVGPVEMHWAHEVLDIDSAEPSPPPSPATAEEYGQYLDRLDRYRHYTLLDPNRKFDNHHYLGGPRNQLLPLKSIPWRRGVPHRRLGNTGSLVRTDLFGCHGTSGSGVFQRNASGELEFLGPVAIASGWGNTRLCTDPAVYGEGAWSLSYTQLEDVHRLNGAYWRTLASDRIGSFGLAR